MSMFVCAHTSPSYTHGYTLVRSRKTAGAGAKDLAVSVEAACKATKRSDFKFLYPLDMPVTEKIETIAKSIYGARAVEFSAEALAQIEQSACVVHVLSKSVYLMMDAGHVGMQTCRKGNNNSADLARRKHVLIVRASYSVFHAFTTETSTNVRNPQVHGGRVWEFAHLYGQDPLVVEC